MEPCKHCAGSGSYLDYVNSAMIGSTGHCHNYIVTKCKYCDGKGWIDEEELFNWIPRKYIKDEYFEYIV